MENKIWFLALSKSFVANIHDAQRFGEIKEILEAVDLLTLSDEEIAGKLEEFAEEVFNKEKDYVVLVGPSRYVFMLGSAMTACEERIISTLQWNKSINKYEEGELVLWQ